MSDLSRLIDERTDLAAGDRARLQALVEEWSLLADLALSDLVLWVPTWNDAGLIAVAQVRPTTAPTSVPDDAVGSFAPRGRYPYLDQAAAFGQPVTMRDIAHPRIPTGVEAFPVRGSGRTIAVVARHASSAPRVAGRLEEIYLNSADDLFAMLVAGRFPTQSSGADAPPRVGDGIIRLDPRGVVEYASPNAVSAMRRLGLATDVVGSTFADLAVRLSRRPGPMDESLSAVAAGKSAGRAEIDNALAAVHLWGIPLLRASACVGTLLFVQDATDLRRRERALVSKDATIREIHHRVKNNLQTVAAMLRLQGRRASSPEAREALAEAELRVAAIAVVHESLSVEDGERVDFDAIIERILALVRDLAPAFATDTGGGPGMERRGSWGDLAAERATALAMTASELVQNAVEHAGARRVTVELGREGDSLVLSVSDDGRGLPHDFDPAQAGLGLSIVQSLVGGELQGSVEFTSHGDGTLVVVTVPDTEDVAA